jgi:hypothetical protein
VGGRGPLFNGFFPARFLFYSRSEGQSFGIQATMTLKWIAERLQMGRWTHVIHLLYWRQWRIKNDE